MKFLLLCFLLVACGQESTTNDAPPTAPTEVDGQELTDLLDNYKYDAGANEVQLQGQLTSLKFKDGVLNNNPQVLAVCYQLGATKWVEVSSGWWGKMSYFVKKKLLYHEFAHCLQGRGHYDQVFVVNGVGYKSIMASVMSTGDGVKVMTDWPILLDELFHPEKYHAASLHDETLIESEECFITPEGATACPISA